MTDITHEKPMKPVLLADLYHLYIDRSNEISRRPESDEIIELKTRLIKLQMNHIDETEKQLAELRQAYDYQQEEMLKMARYEKLPSRYSELSTYDLIDLESLAKRNMTPNGTWTISSDRFGDMLGIDRNTIVLSREIYLRHLYTDTGHIGCSHISSKSLSDEEYKKKLLLYLKRFYCHHCEELLQLQITKNLVKRFYCLRCEYFYKYK